MKKFILVALALGTIVVSLPASAQARERPCGVQFTGSGQRVQTNHLVGPCDTGPDQSGHNGSRGRRLTGQRRKASDEPSQAPSAQTYTRRFVHANAARLGWRGGCGNLDFISKTS